MWLDPQFCRFASIVTVVLLLGFGSFAGFYRQQLHRTNSHVFDYDYDRVEMEAQNVWVLSIGTTLKPEHQEAQRQTIGKHFKLIAHTEDTVPKCELCEIGDGIDFRYSAKYMSRKPEGWWCAQKRGLLALQKVFENHAGELPEFLLIIDDDTFVNYNALIHYVRPIDPTNVVFRGMVGCLPGELTELSYINGGGGALLSRATLQQLMGEPIKQCVAKVQDGDWCDWHSDWTLAECIQEHVHVSPSHVPVRFNQWGGRTRCEELGCSAITCHDFLTAADLIELHTRCANSTAHLTFVAEPEICQGRSNRVKLASVFWAGMLVFTCVLLGGLFAFACFAVLVLRKYQRTYWEEILLTIREM
eukprot:m.151806 g.151806  ORF g.151806 m.151806 type:complete len:359 (+) comp30781_c0_seq1:423-1499(+)